MNLVPIPEALQRILSSVEPLESEVVGLAEAGGRVLAAPLVARRTQPPFAAAAMDGYAFRSQDASAGHRLDIVGEAAAGHAYGGRLGLGEAVRIFTGAPMPDGADTVVPQESARCEAGVLVLEDEVAPFHFVRTAGMDFVAGQEILGVGRRLGPRELWLAAAANCTELSVARVPRVALLSIGDELVPPGSDAGLNQIVASSAVGLRELSVDAGAVVEDVGIAPDRAEALAKAITEAVDVFDVLVTIGGASVGDHDLVRPAFAEAGIALDFWRIAMRPGKPLIFGRRGRTAVLGLPGNPVSSYVCAEIFLRPLLGALQGLPPEDRTEPATLGVHMPANGPRAGFLRAKLTSRQGTLPSVSPLPDQDSSLLSVLAEADCLLIREVGAPQCEPGSICTVIRLRK